MVPNKAFFLTKFRLPDIICHKKIHLNLNDFVQYTCAIVASVVTYRFVWNATKGSSIRLFTKGFKCSLIPTSLNPKRIG
jgi:hypothetical protein